MKLCATSLLVAALLSLGAVPARRSAAGRQWLLRPERVGLAAGALRLPERAFPAQVSRGWQLAGEPLGPAGARATLAASDGVYWNCELRALFRSESGVPPVVGWVFRYDGEGSYTALVWETRTGALSLRALRQGRSTQLARTRVAFRRHGWASLVVRAAMQDVVCYVDGAKVLAATESSLLGRVAVFAAGDRVELDGLEARLLIPQEADADVFGRSRREYEAKCLLCHELNGPWDSSFAPDDWESVVNGMLATEGADRYISRSEADRIIDYLRLISLHPDRRRYRPTEAAGTGRSWR